jgi:hypothetical protein
MPKLARAECISRIVRVYDQLYPLESTYIRIILVKVFEGSLKLL